MHTPETKILWSGPKSWPTTATGPRRQEPTRRPAHIPTKSPRDLLSVNELHRSRYWSLVQVAGLCRSYEVSAGRRGCCTYLLYCSSALLNFDIKAA
jgi:hypothetical protein